ncbi:trypsin-like peptidase domain-containing protein [Candidatus Dependentiae bacterium]|nr:trypsin-like peptidase domain-containing protein [Candidatus Dependentiae bacterium]
MNEFCLNNVYRALVIIGLAFGACEAKSEKLLNNDLTKKFAPQQTALHQLKNAHSWEEICKQSKDAVFQIYSYVSIPNFREPFKSPDRQLSTGSGFCISPEGLILTNFHVINLASVIIMYHPALGREQFELSYVSGCPERDIALLRLTPESCERLKSHLKKDTIPYLECGDSDKLCEAQEIMTLGFPLGQENLKSALGIVAGRENTSIGECIQTTTPVNPGNSGGAFLDKAGNVIGICSLKGVDTEGVGYLIPINSVMLMMETFFEQPIVRCPYWGLEIQPTTEQTLRYLESPYNRGVYISNVKAGSIGELIGLQKGDLLHQIDGLDIDRHGYLESPWTMRKITLGTYLNRLAFKSTACCTIFRNGENFTFEYLVTPRQPNPIDYIHPWIEEMPEYEIIGGLVVGQFTLNYLYVAREMLRKMGGSELKASSMIKYKESDKQLEPRVCITSILPDSQAHKTESFNSADLIISTVNEIPIKTITDFREAVTASIGREYLVIQTEGGSLVALSIKNIIEQEPILAARHHYKISNLVKIFEEKSDF